MTQIIPQFFSLATITNTSPVRWTKPREEKRDGNPLIWRNSFQSHFPFATLEPKWNQVEELFPAGRSGVLVLRPPQSQEQFNMVGFVGNSRADAVDVARLTVPPSLSTLPGMVISVVVEGGVLFFYFSNNFKLCLYTF